MTQPVQLTVYAGARAPAPVASDALSWEAFAAEVAALCSEENAATDKRDLPAIGPYRLREGATRSAAAVERMAAVAALDLDGVDLDRLHARLTELGVAAIVHGSPSDDPAGTRKARAYVALDAEHAPADAGRVRAAVAALLGVTADPACGNADRVFFCGRLAGTPERFCAVLPGRALELATLALPPPAAPAPAPAPAPDRDGAPEVDAATWAILGALGSWREYAGRKHALCGALGGVLRHTPGWSREDCAALVRAWLPAGEPGVDVEAGVRWATAAWDKPVEDVSGRAALEAVVGPRVAAVIAAATLLPWQARREIPAPTSDATPAPAPGDFATLVRVDRTRPPRQLDYLIEALSLAPGKVSAIQAFAYCGKTPFALLLAECVAAGLDFLGFETRQAPAAFVNFEGEVLCEEREARIAAGLELERAAVPLHLFHAKDSLSAAMLGELERLIGDAGIGLVVIDTYSSALPADVQTFNDAAFRLWATELGRLSDRTGACIVVLVHENKSAHGDAGLRGISGHGSLAGGVQAALALDRPDEAEPNVIEVRCARATRKAFEPFRVRWDDKPCESAPDGQALVATRVGGAAPRAAKRTAVASAAHTAGAAAATLAAGRAIMRDIPRGVYTSRKELSALGGEGHFAAERALARLVGAGLLETRTGAYAPTAAGIAAGPLAVATALGEVAGFQR